LKCSVDELEKYAATPLDYFNAGNFTDKKGKKRPKMEPKDRLKTILRNLSDLLQRLDLPDAVHGGRTGRSNLTNAAPHRRKDVVLTFDIEKYFPHITPQHVFDIFHHRCGCSPEVSTLLMRLTTPNNQLAQGSPPSTIIAALVSEPLLKRIQNLIRFHGGVVTIYVDDISISGPKKLVDLKPKIIEIMQQLHFNAHPDKNLIMWKQEEQTVTGVAVNNQLELPKERMADIRKRTHELEKLAGENALIPPEKLGELAGQIGYLARLNLGAGKHYRKRLRKLETYQSRTQNFVRSG